MVQLKHKFVSAKADGSDPTLLQPQRDWNDDHGTDETDTTLVLSPDGAGGVAFVANSASISVTDGSTTVNPATTLTLPAGSVTDGGGGDAVVAFGLIADPGNVWAATTAVAQGYQIASGTHVWQVNVAGTTGTDDPTTYFNLPQIGFSTIVESTGVTWGYLGEISGLPVAVAGNDTLFGLDGATATVSGSAVVNGDGTAVSDLHAQVVSPVSGSASIRQDAVAGTNRAGWQANASASAAFATFDDGLGIGPNGTPATLGMALIADASGYPRWTAIAAADPGDIADPTVATPETNALKINAFFANMRTAGLLA